MAKILIVEDAADIRSSIARVLGNGGHTVTEVSDG
jgi:CheY-like chemotaxis protein